MVSVFVVPQFGQVIRDSRIASRSDIGISKVKQYRTDNQTKEKQATKRHRSAGTVGAAVSCCKLDAPKEDSASSEAERAEAKQQGAVRRCQRRYTAKPGGTQPCGRQQDGQRTTRSSTKGGSNPANRQYRRTIRGGGSLGLVCFIAHKLLLEIASTALYRLKQLQTQGLFWSMIVADGSIAIGELSRRTGCNIETIRYYERIGILPKAARRGRYRSYSKADSDRLSFVRRARELGFTLEEIRALLRIAVQEQLACGEARDIAVAHLEKVRARLVYLRRMEGVLDTVVRACDSDGNVGCPLIETLSATA